MAKTDVYEQFLDATVALFMERYFQGISIGDEAGGSFPEALDQRCRKLLKRECARLRWIAFGKGLWKAVRHVAIVGICLLSLFGFLFITVEAFRRPVINYYIQELDGSWEIGPVDESGAVKGGSIPLEDPLAGLLPEGFVLRHGEGKAANDIIAFYKGPNGETVHFFGTHLGSSLEVDSEGAQASYALQIGGCPGFVVEEGETVRLAWVHEEAQAIFVILAEGLSTDTVIHIAGELTAQLES